MLAVTTINLSILFYLFSLVINSHSLLVSFGFDHESNFVSLLIFMKVYEVVTFVINVLII